jgi:hypothetical protein
MNPLGFVAKISGRIVLDVAEEATVLLFGALLTRAGAAHLASHPHQDRGVSGLLGASGIPGCTFFSAKAGSST